MSRRSAGQRPLALVADDDEDILALVKLSLESARFDVIGARDGEEALQALALAPGLAVLDVRMPALSGYDVTRRIRAGEGTRHMAVILLSARVEESDVALGVDSGADDYVRKPFAPRELAARAEAAFEAAR
jgi:two-component system alkaline phosphatase synthesis response regulator PhoP